MSSHVYGNVPLDLRPVLAAGGRDGTPVWWTEWGATPTPFKAVGDTVFAAAFLLRGMASALGRVGALSHWVASDHFEELGAPPELFHGGFGLLSVGNLRKPRYWALSLLAGMGRERLRVAVSGDGAGGLVDALAARHDDGCVAILVWNMTLDQGKIAGDPRLDREVRVCVHVAPATSYTVRHYRIDARHSNIAAAWERLRDIDRRRASRGICRSRLCPDRRPRPITGRSVPAGGRTSADDLAGRLRPGPVRICAHIPARGHHAEHAPARGHAPVRRPQHVPHPEHVPASQRVLDPGHVVVR